ncbi:nitrate- and nitrite sensing domain-containing protein [Streptomyces sp. ME19-01-6]|uniref:nitrate- and nitrite sensing domain-containing protein n=1 Tax=Streptomyces sp. ME19-01-6 TaxID=3028686 RepID=UPI0029AB165B|nr:nitrate- and nitrite sensing domain-containing protein [Streptomyces sp. ME19-01-6]MDX3230707.1 nitrate- and nitrite sensing domain-containing protein [Streptomyces sp. ME19-01-6]
MRFRGKSIRRKIVALLLVPLVSLTAIWAFATVITSREAIRLLDASDIIDKAGQPAEEAVHAIQKERRQTLVLLADPRQADALPVLHALQRKTDEVMGVLRDAAADSDVRDMMNSETEDQLSAILKAAEGLDALRRKVEDRGTNRAAAYEYYNKLVDLCYTFRSSLHAVPDTDLDKQGRALVAMIRAREALSREDALYVSALTARKMTPEDLHAISDLIAERNLLYETNLPILPASEQKVFSDYRRDNAAPAALRLAEGKLMASSKPSDALQVLDRKHWEAAAQPMLNDYDRLGKEATDRLQKRIDPVADDVMLRAGAAGILGLLALIVSIFVSFRIGRGLIRDLSQLRKDAQEASSVRLPSVLRRLGAGEQIDVDTEAPRLEYGQDEMGQVGLALNTLQRAAVEGAVKQAELRQGVSEVFVNLARRSQVLLHRQLTLLDAMERRTEDTDELADLFRLDHMTTRMRRHAEGLVILSGAAPSRQWRKPIQLMDVVRAAVAEVEDYERIEVRRMPRLAVNGPAVGDLTHLIAELLENATVFSPPHTAVQVHGERVAKGFTLEIHDRGLGMTPDALLEANQRLAETPEFELSDTDRLGLFVVSRLAQRQGVRVSLQPSPYGGTTAIVLIPSALLTDTGETGQEADGMYESGTYESGRERGVSDIRLGPDSRLQAVEEAPVAFSDRAGRKVSVVDGPVELEPSAAPLAQAGVEGDIEDDDEAGAIFRARGLSQTPPAAARPTGPVPHQRVPEAQHQQTRDGAPGTRDQGPAPLPRRVPPVLVSDHGRPVQGVPGGGRHARPQEGGAQSPRPQGGGQPRGGEQSARPQQGGAQPSWAQREGRPGGRGPADGQGRSGPRNAGRPAAPAPEQQAPTAWNGEPARPERTVPAQRSASGLPKRVRQASLAPQLKNDPAPQTEADRYPAETDPEREAEQARATMASLQRGWQRGRRQTATGNSGADTAPGTTYEGDGR